METILHKCTIQCHESFSYLVGFLQTTYGVKDYYGLD